MPVQQLDRQSLFRAIQTQIRNYIVENDLQPGDKLPPAGELTEMLGVSSASLREALRALTALGVLETRHGVGTFVRAYDFTPILENLSYSLVFEKDNLRQLIQVREAMEAGLLGKVIECIDQEDLDTLQAIVDQMDDLQKWADADRRFHQTLYRCLDNRLVSELIDVFWVVSHDLIERHLIIPPSRIDYSRQEHAHILEAIKSGDEDEAIESLRRHFDHARGRLRQGN